MRPHTLLAQERLERLRAYVGQHGDARVVRFHKDEDGFALGQWVSERRRDYKKGALAQDRIDQLEALGFVWTATK